MDMTIKSDGNSRKKIFIFSLLFMGLSHILFLKQYIKGILFALCEIVFIVFLPKIINKIADLITLGYFQPDLPITQRDNSIFMLIDGVMVLAIILLFVIMYAISSKSAISEYKEFCEVKNFKDSRSSLSSIIGKSFPIVALAPTVVLIIFFVLVPLIFAALIAFTNYSSPNNIPPKNTVDWVGLKNFVDLFGGQATWTSALGRVAVWTLVWAFLATTTCYFGGLIMAAVLNESKIKIKPFFRSIFILPYAIPSVVSMLVWQNLLNGSFGTINRTLMQLGIIKTVIPWLSDQWLAKFVCIAINLWAGFPYFMLLALGTMTSISQDIFEAAKIDGANAFQVFKGITFPLVMYQTVPLMIMSFTFNLNNFGAIFFLTGGNPIMADSTITSAKGTDILVTWIYNLTINLYKYNYASVLAVMIFIILAPFAIFNFRRTKSYREGEL